MDVSTKPVSWLLPAASLLVVLVTAVALKVLDAIWWKPLRVMRAFEAQGIKGPPYRIFYGNMAEYLQLTKDARSAIMPQISHNIVPRLNPNFYRWSKIYGVPHLYWLGYRPRLVVADAEMFKEILSNKFGHYRKPLGRPDAGDLLGNGLVSLEGEKWAHHRRIVSPAFFMEKLKAMTPTVAQCAAAMLDSWESQIEKDESRCKEIDVHEEFRTLTADVIAHTAFGSSYAEGKQVFEMQREQQVLMESVFRSVYIPGSRFLPTAFNRYRWKLNKQVKDCLGSIIRDRMDSTEVGRAEFYGNDLLGLMMAANRKELQGNLKNLSMTVEEIIDECKTFFFAGHETTSTLLTWTILLLATNSEWQERAREEVLTVFGGDTPNADSLNHLKIVGMVLNEALRLYPPATAMFRRTDKQMKLGNVLVPEGVILVLPILALHHDPEYWGPDVEEFNPERFADGVANACKHPMAFIPFSTGPRNCVGQNFAYLEARIVLSMILQRFSFQMSPSYKHAPTTVLTTQPQYGMQVIVKKIS